MARHLFTTWQLSLTAASLLVGCTQDWNSDSPSAEDASVDTGRELPLPDRDPISPNGAADADVSDAGTIDAERTVEDAQIEPARGPDAAIVVSCAPNPCLNNGTCSVVDNAARCACPSGFSGANCEDTNECDGNHGCDSRYPCRDFKGGYMCVGQTMDWPIARRSSLDGTDLAAKKLIVDEAAGTLLDQTTGLMWQRAFRDIRDADYAAAQKHCEELELGGFPDWRIPSILELATIWTTDSVPEFLGLLPPIQEDVWTKTEAGSNQLLLAKFNYPYKYAVAANTSSGYHLCVRTQAIKATGTPLQRLAVNATSNTIHDARTQLTWQREADPQASSYSAAASYCAQREGGSKGWRLPTMAELLSLTDLGNGNAERSIRQRGFLGSDGYYWSSTLALASRTAPAHIIVRSDLLAWYWGATGDGTLLASDVGKEGAVPPPVYTRCVHNGAP